MLAARLTHQSGQQWSHDIPVAGGKITVKVEPVREAEAEYVGSSSKFETDLSIESQSSAAQGHGASLRTSEGFRVQIPIPRLGEFRGQHRLRAPKRGSGRHTAERSDHADLHRRDRTPGAGAGQPKRTTCSGSRSASKSATKNTVLQSC